MVNNNYTIYHLHSDYSNGTTNVDSVTKPVDYIKEAKKMGMNAMAFSEHGNIYDWLKKKDLIEDYGLKYIHGVELYVTESLIEKKRDNYHIGLYAKNYEGFLEINKLVSIASNRLDGHFYYVPRITFEELINTSDDIIVTTACIGGILFKSHQELKDRFIEFLSNNKYRCFLEVQAHKDDMQIEYNKYLLNLNEEFQIPLIAGTDTHALNEKHKKGRKIMQISKNIKFDGEDNWIITMMTYDELVKAFVDQCALPEEKIYEAIDNTNVLANMIGEYKIDNSFKYPKIVDDGEATLKSKINNGILNKKLNKYPNYVNEYLPRITYELDVYRKQEAIDYLLLDEDIKTHAKNNGIFHGPSRGSVSGSLIAYIIGITEIDPIKEKLNFERFMNVERISLADIDTDWPSSKREFVKEYVFGKENLYCADIITFNTVALKGAIRDVCRALYNKEVPKELSDKAIEESKVYGIINDKTKQQLKLYTDGYLNISNYISKNIETSEDVMRLEYPEVFEYVDIVNGTIVSVGSHPCGSIVSPIPLDINMGLSSLATSKNPLSMLSMKMVDKLNYVKLDILGLDNIEIINETCKLAGIERLTCDNIPYDKNVFNSIRENTIGVFQWESDSATKYIERLFSPETIKKIESVYPDFNYIDLLSVGNGAIRPAGASYREELAVGMFRENGHEALNEMLASTLGYLIYQEQIIEFLNKFCGFTMGQADMVRRAFSKKIGTEDYIPKIKQGFINTMKEKYDVGKVEAEKIIENFLQVIVDASDYLFSLNHSQAYSYIGYMCAYLKYYYPLEFFTVSLNVVCDNIDKTAKIMNYLSEHNIKIEQPTFGKSRAKYFLDKENNVIYKGLESIKFLNSSVAEKLYLISQSKKITSFHELYFNTQGVNSKQWNVLIKIGFFREFGSTKKLLKYIELKNKYKNKNYKKSNLNELETSFIKKHCESETEKMYNNINHYNLLEELFNNIEEEEFNLAQLINFQFEFMGSSNIIDKNVDRRYCVVVSVDTKYTPTLKLYRINNAEIIDVKVYKKDFLEKEVNEFDVIYVNTCNKKHRKTKTLEGKWIELEEFNYYITYYLIDLQ